MKKDLFLKAPFAIIQVDKEELTADREMIGMSCVVCGYHRIELGDEHYGLRITLPGCSQSTYLRVHSKCLDTLKANMEEVKEA